MTHRLRVLLLGTVLVTTGCTEPPTTPSPVSTAALAGPATLVLGAGESASALGTPVRIWVDRIVLPGDGAIDCVWADRCRDAPAVRVITEVAGTGARTDLLWLPQAGRVDALEYAGYVVRLTRLEPAWRADAVPGTEYRAVVEIVPR
jgi:hypothetical protein